MHILRGVEPAHDDVKIHSENRRENGAGQA
jgi:hypothetical protein